jgi:hypothetical protein
MSTLSISPRNAAQVSDASDASDTSDVDARFDALVRSAVPAQRAGSDNVAFDAVFDLDYGQPADAPAVHRPRTARPAARIRVAPPTPRPTTRRSGRSGRSVRLTRRGRVVAVLVFLGLALAAMTLMGGWATATLDGGTPEPVRVVEVAPGDTLYDIAADLAQPGEVRAMVHKIQELNSLPGASIEEGQKLAVPRG